MTNERIPPWEHPEAFGTERTNTFNGKNCVGCGRFKKGKRKVRLTPTCKRCNVIRYWPIFRPRVQGSESGWYGWDEKGEWIWNAP